ncbi:MAG: hypothetical protein JST81_00920 [Bacteroidetes bacterium]|nr:hypothetical protein [Bacteroidota bacterium]
MSTKTSFLKNKRLLIPAALVVVGLLMSFHRPIMGLIAPATLDLKIQHQPVIMPALYKVYANENALEGKYSLFKMLVTNNSGNVAKNVEVSYQIPNYIEWKQVAKIKTILPGQSVVVNCYPSFPDKIVEKTTTSKEQVNIKVSGPNISEAEESFAIDIKGRNEFMYTCIPSDEIRTSAEIFDNMALLSCYVTPEDPIIKYYTQKVQEKVLKGEDASVGNKEQEGVRFLTGIYYSTLVSHMVYSGTSGVPAKIDDVSSIIQSIRLPREVITGKTGLCIELSLLYASILMDAGLDPVIYLIPGHAYPGFKMNGKYYAIEATGIGGEGIGGRSTPEQALQTGMKNLDEFFQRASQGDDRYMLVDIRESINQGALAMELKDDNFLRQKVDEIAQAFGDNYQANNYNAQPVNYENNGGGNDNNGNADPNGYQNYTGIVNFAYPASWRAMPHNPQSMPQLKSIISNSGNTAYVEIYQFNGYNSTSQAIQSIQQYVSNQFGGNMQYTSGGQTASGYEIISGKTTVGNQGIYWKAAFKSTGNGIAGIATGANFSTGSNYESTVNNIINSLR